MGQLFYGPHLLHMNGQLNKGYLVSFSDSNNENQQQFHSQGKQRMLSLCYWYHFNGLRYTALAPMTGTFIQRKSAGSPIVGAFAWSGLMSDPERLFPEESPITSTIPSVQVSAFSAGLSGG